MRIELFSYDTRFFKHSSIYDDCRRPPRVAPAADQEQTIQKKTCPPCLGEALRRGSIVYIAIFMVFSANTLFMPVSTEPKNHLFPQMTTMTL